MNKECLDRKTYFGSPPFRETASIKPNMPREFFPVPLLWVLTPAEGASLAKGAGVTGHWGLQRKDAGTTVLAIFTTLSL